MIEIGAQVDLSHPADRVWHTLTDRELLARWFTEAEVVAGAEGRLLLHTAGMAGFDAAVDVEVAERRAPELLVLRCHEAGRNTVLTCTITPIAQGCRLSVLETMEHGSWPVEQRTRRAECYQRALTGRLPAILDWLAFRQVDRGGAEVGATAELPVTELPGEVPGSTDRRRRPVLIAAVLAAGAAVWAVLPAEPQHAAGPDPTPVPPPTVAAITARSPRPTPARSTPTPSRSGSVPRPTPKAPPSRTRPTPASTAAVTARYETVSTRVFGWTGEVGVDNPGGAAADWTVVVTLSPGSTIVDVRGAEWRQDGQAFTFTGSPVPAGRSQTFSFDVRSPDLLSKAPASCTVGDSPCAGV